MQVTDLSRAVSVLVSPTRTFRSIVVRPSWWAPFLVIVLLQTVFLSIEAPRIDWRGTIDTKLERSAREVEDPERIEFFSNLMEEHATVALVSASVVLPWILYPLLAALFRRLFEWTGGELSFRTSFAVLLHGLMPFAVGLLIGIPVVLRAERINLYDPGWLVPNLTAFASDETALEAYLLLANIDLFSIWAMVLLVIGYSVAAKVTKLRAAVGLVGLWALWVAFNVGLAALDRLA